jgi:TRAP-type C4-dicarboxylate transport system permease large subunit
MSSRTPLVPTHIFVGVGVAKTSIAGVLRPLLPLYAAMIVALILVTYVPGITLSLPRLLGLL